MSLWKLSRAWYDHKLFNMIVYLTSVLFGSLILIVVFQSTIFWEDIRETRRHIMMPIKPIEFDFNFFIFFYFFIYECLNLQKL